MKKNKSNTTILAVIILFVLLIIGVLLFMNLNKLSTEKVDKESNASAVDKQSNQTDSKQENDTTDTNKNTETNKNTDTNTTTTTSSIPNEEKVKELMINYIKTKQTSAVDYRINSISFENNTKEFKEMIQEDQEHVLVYVDYDLIRDGNGYTKEQGWIKANQSCCILVKDSSGSYYVEKCGSGW